VGAPWSKPRSTNVVLAAEHYNMIVRLLDNGVPVKLRVSSQSHFTTDRDTDAYNVVAEIPGTDPRLRDEVVMAGAHIDSWHSGLGAADNADGVAVMLEVMRILKAVGVQPRRTIRIAIWGGEEEGLLGSCAWTRQHLAADAVAFTSSSTVTRFAEALAGHDLARVRGVSIGPVTSSTARARGVGLIAEALEHDLDGLVAALLRVLSEPPEA